MGDPANETDRRDSPRVPRQYPVSANKSGSESISQEKIAGVLHDVSGSGLSFLTEADYSVGDTLDLEIDLPGAHHRITVKVVRVEVMGDSKIVGAHFLDVSSEHEKALIKSLLSSK